LAALSVVTFTAFSNPQQNDYKIVGAVSNAGLNGKYVYLYEYGVENLSPLDSAKVQDRRFIFNGSQSQPVLRTVRFSNSDVPLKRAAEGENPIFSSTFILEEGNIRILLDTVSYAVGTAENDALKELQSYLITQRKSQQSLMQNFDTASDGEKGMIELEYKAIGRDITGKVKEYITKNPDKVSGGKILYDFRHSLTEDERRELLAKANNTFKSVPTTKLVIDHLNVLAKVAVGQKFTDFEMADTEGNVHSLSDYVGKGKVVLIDFWTSWCPPCRKEMPELVRIYAENKNKGFEIVGISLDSNKEAWEKGIKDLKITWPQLSDLKGWSNTGAALYGVNFIPHMLLIDRDGKIIAKNLHGTDLENAIKAAL
ncbi:MAG: AhpC/TSA family protein, partial [Tannerellaceae bacterium]|nr:AhpC/TSA family protein [Tannerellaceae bacterium]